MCSVAGTLMYMCIGTVHVLMTATGKNKNDKNFVKITISF